MIRDTELILTYDKKIYHLNLSKDQIADDIILVGDPDRVALISHKFDAIEHKVSNREFVTHTGQLNGKRISVISTGIGTDNIDIVINELDALVNIDFTTRTINSDKKSLNLIRLGTSGALQEDIAVDSFLASSYGLGFDNLAHFYTYDKILNKEMSVQYLKHASWPKKLIRTIFCKSI
jgi:uridine phosphorylase